MTTKTNLTAWTATPGQIRARDAARQDRYDALRIATRATSQHTASMALRAIERADKRLLLLDSIQATQFPDELLRLSHATLWLMESSSQCPHCLEDGVSSWRQDIQGLECDDSRTVLECSSCGGHWSVPLIWIEEASDAQSVAD